MDGIFPHPNLFILVERNNFKRKIKNSLSFQQDFMLDGTRPLDESILLWSGGKNLRVGRGVIC